jgi:glutamate racemase
MHPADAPIGVLIQALEACRLRRRLPGHLPNERILYYADTAHVALWGQIRKFDN